MRTLNGLTSVSSAALFAAAIWAAPAAAEDGALASPDDPMTIVVSLPNQRASIYRGTSLVTTTAVSTGKRGHATKAGVYSILEKRRRHYSNLYGGAPMPWMQRLTWTGTALHAGVVPGYPASHGCIRLPYSFAPKLFAMTEVGAQVVVAHSAVTPKPISHPALFQPLPPPMPPELVKQDEPAPKPIRKSSNETSPTRPFRLPVIFANAATVTPKPVAQKAAAKLALIPNTTNSIAPAQQSAPSHSLVDTTAHAIDPGSAPFMASGSHALTADADETTGSIQSADDGDKHQDRLVDNAPPKSEDRLTTDAMPASDTHAASKDDAPVEASAEDSLAKDSVAEDSVAERPAAGDSDMAEAAAEDADAPVIRSASLETEALATDASEQETGGDDAIGEIVRETETEAAAENETATEPGLEVSAGAVQPKVQKPVDLSLSVLGVNDHPPRPLERPSVMLSRVGNGAGAAAVEAADPISQEPLRILITRRTERDRTVDVQYMLSDMGYLDPQNFDGTRGSATVRAIKAFQQDNDMPETGALTDEVIKKVYAVAGKEEPAEGQLFVRQKFQSVFSAPVSFTDPDKPLGTHLFTVMHFQPGATQAGWTAISLNDKESAESVLNRIQIPEDVRRRVSQRLTPGSSLIVADTAINSAALPKGADFLVWDTSRGAAVQRASTSPSRQVRRRTTADRPRYTRERSASRYSTRRSAPQRRGFFPF